MKRITEIKDRCAEKLTTSPETRPIKCPNPDIIVIKTNMRNVNQTL
jgi:hypothetical protein